MKYCMQYYKESQYLDKVDEITIDFDRIESNKALLTFCKEHKNQRININIWDLERSINEKSIENFLKIQEDYPEYNIYLAFPGKDETLGVFLNKYKKAKFYFTIKVNDWDRFIGFIDYGVSDIYIVEGLGFELDKIAEIAHQNNVQIRVYPNVAQSSWQDLNDLRKFWIRPEDISFYDDYVDVCEFYGEKEKFDILYNIYKKDKKWFGNLKEIIIDLHQDLDSRFIAPRFVKKRVKCGRQCLKGGNCQMCDRVIELSANLEKAGLMVTLKKNKEMEEKIDGKGTNSESRSNEKN